MFNFSKPTVDQVRHDLFAIIVAFGSAFFVTLQTTQAPLSKQILIAAVGSGVAAVVAVIKSIATDF